MIQAPINNVLVKVGNIFKKNITDITRLAYAEVNADINPADFVTIVGEVVSVPRAINTKARWLKDFSLDNIRKGDTAIFSYSVIYSFDVSDVNQKFKNCFWYKGQEYWICDIYNLFGIIRGNGIQMVNGYCMIEGMKPISTLILPNSLKHMLNVAEATLTHSSGDVGGILPGDKIFYNPLKVQEYELNGKKFGIIERKHIMGGKISDYSDLQRIN